MAPVEITELRTAFAAVRDGEATWSDLVAAKTGELVDGARPRTSAIKDQIAAKVNGGKRPPAKPVASGDVGPPEPGSDG
jgi:hypothetical protein